MGLPLDLQPGRRHRARRAATAAAVRWARCCEQAERPAGARSRRRAASAAGSAMARTLNANALGERPGADLGAGNEPGSASGARRHPRGPRCDGRPRPPSSADRSTATMCPDASRSHTRVTATPWPQPTSSTRDDGPGPSWSTAQAMRSTVAAAGAAGASPARGADRGALRPGRYRGRRPSTRRRRPDDHHRPHHHHARGPRPPPAAPRPRRDRPAGRPGERREGRDPRCGPPSPARCWARCRWHRRGRDRRARPGRDVQRGVGRRHRRSGPRSCCATTTWSSTTRASCSTSSRPRTARPGCGRSRRSWTRRSPPGTTPAWRPAPAPPAAAERSRAGVDPGPPPAQGRGRRHLTVELPAGAGHLTRSPPWWRATASSSSPTRRPRSPPSGPSSCWRRRACRPAWCRS